jgi:hypothetical protein
MEAKDQEEPMWTFMCLDCLICTLDVKPFPFMVFHWVREKEKKSQIGQLSCSLFLPSSDKMASLINLFIFYIIVVLGVHCDIYQSFYNTL